MVGFVYEFTEHTLIEFSQSFKGFYDILLILHKLDSSKRTIYI